MSTLTFEDLGLSPNILSGLKDVHYSQPTELQQTLIPTILDGDDIIVYAGAKEGKYGSFIIPALEKLERGDDREGTKILIITPEAEAARKIDEFVWALGYHAEIDCASLDSEGDYDTQEEALKNGATVVAANPDRLSEILQKNRLVLRNVELLAIDALDLMVDNDHSDQIKSILKRVISDHQTVVLYNAESVSKETRSLCDSILNEPKIVGMEKPTLGKNGHSSPPSVSQKLTQGYINVPSRMKITTLMAHLDHSPSDNCVIFTASKRGTDRLYRVLRKRKYKATSIHSGLKEETRTQRFANFAEGDVQFLLVADISAAELGLNNVKQVINYDVPNDPDEYRYRAGLVQSGKVGRIVSLVSKQDRSDIQQLRNELGQAPQELPLPEKVKKKLKNRKKGRNRKKQGKKRSNRKRSKKRTKKRDKLELPRPSYDKLSGGKSGKKGKKSEGVLGFIKKLFS